MANIRKETLWALSNVTAGSATQTKAAITEGVVANALALTRDSDREVAREALLVVVNAVMNADDDSIALMKESSFVDGFIWLLKNYKDPEFVIYTLKSLIDFMRKGDNDKMNVDSVGIKDEANTNASYFERRGGLEVLELMQFDKNENIHKLVTYIMTRWFSSKIEEYKYK